MSTWKNPDGSTSTGIYEDFQFKEEPKEGPEKAEKKPVKKTSKKK